MRVALVFRVILHLVKELLYFQYGNKYKYSGYVLCMYGRCVWYRDIRVSSRIYSHMYVCMFVGV